MPLTDGAQNDLPPGVKAAWEFETLVSGQRPSIEQLSRTLDKLCAAYHETPEGKPGDDANLERRTPYSERRQLLSLRFQSLGFYQAISPKEPPAETKPVFCNAIDDLADILGDLQDVLSVFEMSGADNANWLYRQLYEIHWGRHLRHLSLYLYVKQFDGW